MKKSILVLLISVLIFSNILLIQPVESKENNQGKLAATCKEFQPDSLIVKTKSPDSKFIRKIISGINRTNSTQRRQRTRTKKQKLRKVKSFKKAFNRKLSVKTNLKQSAKFIRGINARKKYGLDRIYKIDLENSTCSDIKSLVKKLNNHPDIEYAEPNYKIHLNTITTPVNDPRIGETWGISQINADKAWQYSTGEGVIVAVVDTGVDYNHPDLWDNIWVNPELVPDNNNDGKIGLDDIDDDGNKLIEPHELAIYPNSIGYDFGNNDIDPMDTNSHGTHVAGTIAAVSNNSRGVVGVAPEAKILPVKIAWGGGSIIASDAASALEYLAHVLLTNPHVNSIVANHSWGMTYDSHYFRDAFAYSSSVGVISVAAASNDDMDAVSHSPVSFDTTIGVAAINIQNQRSFFSNYGGAVDIAAPGSDILSTTPGNQYDSYSGTSMATPHITGVVALIKSLHPEYKLEEIKYILRQTSRVINDSKGLLNTGSVDALAAVLYSNPVEQDYDHVDLSTSIELNGFNFVTNDEVTLVLNVTNSSEADDIAENTIVSLRVPNLYFTYSSIDSRCQEHSPIGDSMLNHANITKTFTCKVGSLAPGQTESIIFNFQALEGLGDVGVKLLTTVSSLGADRPSQDLNLFDNFAYSNFVYIQPYPIASSDLSVTSSVMQYDISKNETLNLQLLLRNNPNNRSDVNAEVNHIWVKFTPSHYIDDIEIVSDQFEQCTKVSRGYATRYIACQLNDDINISNYDSYALNLGFTLPDGLTLYHDQFSIETTVFISPPPTADPRTYSEDIDESNNSTTLGFNVVRTNFELIDTNGNSVIDITEAIRFLLDNYNDTDLINSAVGSFAAVRQANDALKKANIDQDSMISLKEFTRIFLGFKQFESQLNDEYDLSGDGRIDNQEYPYLNAFFNELISTPDYNAAYLLISGGYTLVDKDGDYAISDPEILEAYQNIQDENVTYDENQKKLIDALISLNERSQAILLSIPEVSEFISFTNSQKYQELSSGLADLKAMQSISTLSNAESLEFLKTIDELKRLDKLINQLQDLLFLIKDDFISSRLQDILKLSKDGLQFLSSNPNIESELQNNLSPVSMVDKIETLLNDHNTDYDFDGDNDTDTNDIFLLYIVASNASDYILGLYKGASSLTSQEIRSKVHDAYLANLLDFDSDGSVTNLDAYGLLFYKLGYPKSMITKESLMRMLRVIIYQPKLS